MTVEIKIKINNVYARVQNAVRDTKNNIMARPDPIFFTASSGYPLNMGLVPMATLIVAA